MNTTNTSGELYAIDIANMALQKLGEKPIQGFNPNGSKAERLCHMHYHPTRLEVLSACAWGFATSTVTLTEREKETSNGETTYRFKIPFDCLRIMECDCDDWMLRGRKINTKKEVESITIKYIRDEEDTSIFEPLFIEAFATRLACKLCIPLSQTDKKISAREKLKKEFEDVVIIAEID